MKKITACVIAATTALAFAGTANSGHHMSKEGHGDKATHYAKKKLKKMDTNKDGKISQAEFNNHKDKWWMKVDADKDGAITMEEIKHWKMNKKHHKGEHKSKEKSYD